MNTQPVFVGIDISKNRLDVHLRPQGTSFAVPYTDTGVASLLKRMQKLEPQLVLLEATGGYEARLVTSFMRAQLPLVVMNPRRVRDFAKATGRLAKTDRIDAEVLAHFAEAIHPELRALPDGEHKELAALMSRRCQLVEMMVMEKNRWHTTTAAVRIHIRSHLEWLEAELKEIDGKIDQLIAQAPLLNRKAEVVKSVPGVGPTICRGLISYLPELGNITNKQISALVGVAPFNSDSGGYTGKRIVWGGRKQVRSMLYMGTLVATRYNPVIRSFYQRLVAKGKAKKVALTACMRKLLIILNAMVRTDTLWCEN